MLKTFFYLKNYFIFVIFLNIYLPFELIFLNDIEFQNSYLNLVAYLMRFLIRFIYESVHGWFSEEMETIWLSYLTLGISYFSGKLKTDWQITSHEKSEQKTRAKHYPNVNVERECKQNHGTKRTSVNDQICQCLKDLNINVTIS